MAQKNFLFLSIDDLNDWTGGLGGYSGTVHTPNMDALMDQGTTFTNAFSQAAICNASRTSALTGLEPQHTGVFKNQYHHWEERVDPADTLFGVFHEEGYNSQGVGKLFHTSASPEGNAAMFDNYAYMGDDDFGVETDGKPVGVQPNSEKPADARRAEYVAEYLSEYDPADGPLLMSVGLLKPHVAWVVEQKYFDLYPLDEIQIDYVPNDIDDIPDYVLEVVGQEFPWSADDVGSELAWKKLIQAYLATISFMDEQVGVMIDALDNSAIADNTAVVLWSDHGYHLGDKDSWHKFTLWDNAARAPLIIRDPGTVPAGLEVDDPVELLDIFPTMLDMAGISGEGMSLDGKSLVPYFQGSAPEGEAAAFTWMYGNVSIRTADYRYSLYEDGSEELYHVSEDPELTFNLADDPAFAAIKAGLRGDLYDKFHLVGYGDTAANLFGTSADNVLADTDGGTVAGGAGNDIYFVTNNVTVVEDADGGRDMIITRAQDYTLPDFVEDLEVIDFSRAVTGNNLDNTIIATATRIDTQGGDDVVIAGLVSSLISAGTGNDLIKAENGEDTVYAGQGADTIEGGNGHDQIFGGTGNDQLHADNGDDVIYGEAGFDTLRGGNGNDRLEGGAQADQLFGGAGDDVLRGGGGLDWLFGQAGADLMDGGDGHDRLDGGGGDDTLSGGRGADRLFGQLGADRLFGQSGFDTLVGGHGDDHLEGGDQADNLFGDSGNDALFGGAGFDRLFGGAGEDTLTGGQGIDRLDGGAGMDMASYSGSAMGLRIDLQFAQLNTGDAASDILVSIEGLRGTAQNDNLRGDQRDNFLQGEQGNDVLFGRAGADQLQGGAGHDYLIGGAGADHLIGGAGQDRAQYNTAATSVVVDLQYTGSNTGDAAGDSFDSIERVFGSQFNDHLRGDDAGNVLWGHHGDDVLFGRGGNDALIGGRGNDLLLGGAGADRLVGQAGADTFIFEEGFGADVVLDFEYALAGERIDLRNVSAITSFADLSENHIRQAGAHVVIDAGEGNTIRLNTISVSQLGADDFLF